MRKALAIGITRAEIEQVVPLAAGTLGLPSTGKRRSRLRPPSDGSNLAPGSGMAFDTILCPVDFSDSSREAMRQAADIARASGGSMTLLHVVHVPLTSYGEGAPMMPSSGFTLEKEMGAEADKHLASWKQRAEEMGVRSVSTSLASGVPWHEIVEAARRDPSFDLIVLGTQGRTGLGHILLGSVAERVVRQAPCPVLVVRARQKD